MTPQFIAIKDASGFRVLNKQKYQAYVRGLKPGNYHVVIKKQEKQRSNNQNKYYWSVVVGMISDETGLTPDETHEALKIKFLPKHHDILPTVKSTTKLSTIEFQAYIAEIVMFAAEFLGVIIPDPNECDYSVKFLS
jgi:hypothetical protein